jgi:hypothetical protein
MPETGQITNEIMPETGPKATSTTNEQLNTFNNNRTIEL